MKKVAVSTIKNFLKENKKPEYVVCKKKIAESEFEFQMKTHLTVDERTTFINRVVNSCFDDVGTYHPEYVSPMIKATILQMYTDLPVLTLKSKGYEGGEMYMDLDAMEALYDALNLDSEHGFYLSHVDLEDDCICAIERKIDMMMAEMSSRESDGLRELGLTAAAVRELVEKFSTVLDPDKLDKLTEYAGKLSKATEELEEGSILNGLIHLYHNDAEP